VLTQRRIRRLPERMCEPLGDQMSGSTPVHETFSRERGGEGQRIPRGRWAKEVASLRRIVLFLTMSLFWKNVPDPDSCNHRMYIEGSEGKGRGTRAFPSKKKKKNARVTYGSRKSEQERHLRDGNATIVLNNSQPGGPCR